MKKIDIKNLNLDGFNERYHNLEKYMIDDRTIKHSIQFGFTMFHFLLIISVFVALWDPNFGFIDGYSFVDNYISDLGGSPFTPMPILYDLAGIIAGCIAFPLMVYYVEEQITPIPQKKEDLQKLSRWRIRFANIGFLFAFIGSVGYVLVGIFSEDRSFLAPAGFSLPMSTHQFASILAFGGFVFAGIAIGMSLLLYETEFPKMMGLYMVIGPPLTLILFLVLPPLSIYPITAPFMEWMLMISVLIWMDPLAIKILKNLRLKENGEEPEKVNTLNPLLKKVLNKLKNIDEKVENSLTSQIIVGYSFLIGIAVYSLSIIFVFTIPAAFPIIEIIVGLISIPIILYIEKKLTNEPENLNDVNDFSRTRYKLVTWGFLFGIIWSLFLILSGITAFDPSTQAAFILIGIDMGAFGIICYSIIIILDESNIPKLIGILGIIGSITSLIFFAINTTLFFGLIYTFEVLFFGLLIITLQKEINLGTNPLIVKTKSLIKKNDNEKIKEDEIEEEKNEKSK
ncbi:MAG: DUF998 domain-containing protein [archaeon]|nr:DUF998 domain-containing protein [archaeon]